MQIVQLGQWIPAIVGAASAAALVIWLEGRPSTWHLGAAAFLIVFSFIHLFVPGPLHALSIALLVAGAIGLASKSKQRFLGTNLVAGDFLHATRNTLNIVATDYRATNLRLIATVAAGGLVVATVFRHLADAPSSLWARILFFSASAAAGWLAFVAGGSRRRFRTQLLTQDRAHLSFFAASFLGAGPSSIPSLVGMADEPLALVAAPAAAPGSRRPHIVMVLHESTFDPALLDLPTDARFDPFFRPPGSAAGTLAVDIYGGGTWQTEFSVYAGLSSLCFGADAPFVFQLLAGRVRHSLPAFLTKAGYRTNLVTSDVVPSPSHHRFYRSIGFERIDDPALLAPPFDFASWKRSYDDGPIYEHALRTIARDLSSAHPLFLSLMTLSNHGPHTRHRQRGTGYDLVRQEFSARTGSAEFGEYMARLAASADAWARFRSSLAELLDGEPALLVRFGDHHPSFTAQMTGLPRTDRRLRETFFAVEPINMDLPAGIATPRLTDAAFLSTLTVAAAGLPLDPVFATRRTLMDACSASYADCRSPMRDRFHRTLVDEGLIDLS